MKKQMDQRNLSMVMDLYELTMANGYFDHEKNNHFPNKTNVEFIEIQDKKIINMRVWERGSGETLACGTGACAVAAACILNGLTENKVTVKLLGGSLVIEWDREQDQIFMAGPAETVFEGTIEI